MTDAVSIVGARGRVGSALGSHLATRFAVTSIARVPGEDIHGLAERAVKATDVLINAAGVAHIEQPTSADVQRLHEGNVDLPVALARAALERCVPMIHISSVKAGDSGAVSEYAASKREAEQRLDNEHGIAFATRDLSLVVVRPLALLFPPFDAGRVRWLGFIRRWPRALTPVLRLPVLAPGTFLAAIEALVDQILTGEAPTGFSRREFAADERGTWRDVRDAMVAARRTPAV